MTTVAVIGANGGVGSEVSLLLSLMEDVTVIPIVRASYSTSYLKRMGLTCRVGSVTNDEQAASLLDGVDVLVDFSLPGGLRSAVRAAQRKNIQGAMRHLPKDAVYVFASTTVAFGVNEDGTYADHQVARTQYASNKRYGEKLVFKLAKRSNRRAFVFRLGEVHGELQASSRYLATSIDGRPIALHAGGEADSDVVFCSTIADGLVKAARGDVRAGCYTLVESPTWSLRRVYEVYATIRSLSPEFIDGSPSRPSAAARAFGPLKRATVDHKELLMAQVLPPVASVEQRMRAPWLVRAAASDLAVGQGLATYTPEHRIGPVPGPRFPGLERSFEALAPLRAELRRRLHQRFGPDAHVFPVDPR